jgi:hypothetical protein
MATTALRRKVEHVSPTRQRVMGIIFLSNRLFYLVFLQPADGGRPDHNFRAHPGPL